MLAEVGHFAIIFALFLSLLQIVYFVVGFNKNRQGKINVNNNNKVEFVEYYCSLGKFFTITVWFLVSIAFFCLVFCFVNDDFSVKYVAENSNSQLNSWYKACAVWGGHEGSILLWIFILQFWNLAIVVFARNNISLTLISIMLATTSFISSGLLSFLVFTSNPFLRITHDIPIEGLDLNPLLQDFAFIIHPPMLYLGYVGTTVIFAFAIAVLLLGKIEQQWVSWIRVFAAASFAFLTLGIVGGSFWAYYELGWGGWWFWDPVENASLMPWLLLAAFLHVLIIVRHKKSYINWALLLAILTFTFSLLGTFLVRSGIITSVHSFVNDPKRGNYILTFISFVIGSSLLIYALRIGKLKNRLKFSLLSQETFLLSNSAFLVILACTILLGTLYPLIVEILFNRKISVGAPYFNAVVVPICVLVLPLMVVANNVKFGNKHVESSRGDVKSHSTDFSSYKKIIVLGGISFLATLILLFFFAAFITIMALVGVTLGIFIILGTITHDVKYLIHKIPMVLAHVGLGVTIIGITIVSIYSIEKNVTLTLNEELKFITNKIIFSDMTLVDGSNYVAHKATFKILQSNTKAKAVEIYPEKRFFLAQETYMTETALLARMFSDIYIAVGDNLGHNTWSFRIYYKPFVRWIWFGGILVALGAFMTFYNRKKNPAASS